MTEPSIILLLSRLMLALVALLALVSYLRARDRAHLEVTLMLACVAIPGMSGLLPDDLLPAWFSNSNAILLSAQPYLALRLVAFFKPVPRWVMLPATAGLALSWVAVVLDEQPLETATIFGVLVYILAATLYATWAFYQGMRHSGGAFRGRLGSAAAGSGLMALTFVALGLGSIAPGIADVATDFLPMLVAVAFYLAFIPPRWLRQAWQLPELHRFLTQLAFSNPLDRLNRAGLDLCGTTTRLTDGTGSAVLHWDASKRQLVTEATDNPLLAGQEYGPDEGVIGRVWRDRVPLLVASGEELGEKESWIAKTLESHALLAVPIEGLESARGVLLAFRPRGKLFASDLLEMMQLLAAQYAITLENAELLSEQQRLVEFLRSANEEMEAFSYSVS
ncbi:MAG: GAF domain-containing protein, partial [Dehalococcoidia bacterium]